MSITRAQIIQRSRDRLDNDGTERLTDARLYRAFNDVQRDWADDTKCLSAQVAVDLTSGQQSYDLSAPQDPLDPDLATPNLLQIRRVRILLGSQRRDLEPVSFDRLPESYEIYNGLPCLWAARGTSTLYVWPTPASTIANGLLIDSFNLPADLAEDASDDAAALPFPDSHRRGLVLGMCLAMVEIGLDEPTTAARLGLLRQGYAAELQAVASREGDVSSRPVSYASAVRMDSGRAWRRGPLPYSGNGAVIW